MLEAARHLFAERGPDVALEEVAAAAGVSRTTLYRNFETREQLVATVYESAVELVEARARELADRSTGVVELFDFVLDLQRANRSLVRVLAGADISWFGSLAERTVTAFEVVLVRGRVGGVVHAGVGMAEIFLALQMAEGAMAQNERVSRERWDERIREMLHRALFVA
ncbi:TetR/AcrR family transcriptional regulator [Micromonospora polyrhachis]